MRLGEMPGEGGGERERDAHADLDNIWYTRYRFTQINPREEEKKRTGVEFVSDSEWARAEMKPKKEFP